MNRVKVLDCTLRDGGYVNNWEFGKENIENIISYLVSSEIDIIECGFLSNTGIFNQDSSKFNTLNQVDEFIPDYKESFNGDFVVMINFGDYDLSDVPDRSETKTSGIRVAFHKKNLNSALVFCEGLKAKGYNVFVQAMVTISYSDKEFISLIEKANSLQPYAFYIVDSFGVMKINDLLRLYYLLDHNLDKEIIIGYHSHNNLQLAYSNAQALANIKTNRRLILDVSVYGMGRGAGNLNTELFIEYLNETNNSQYKIKPILKIIDEVLYKIYKTKFWGYSLPHYLSARHNTHPNYASHLDSKDTLSAQDIENILNMLDNDARVYFDRKKIENLYIEYQSHIFNDTNTIKKIKEIVSEKKVLLIAPGSSINQNSEKIKKLLNDEYVSFSVNFLPKEFNTNYYFISNKRRFDAINNHNYQKLIVSSNITKAKDFLFKLNYKDLLIDDKTAYDNSGLMLINFISKLNPQSIHLAGFDGYSYDHSQNYYKDEVSFVKEKTIVDNLNLSMEKFIRNIKKTVKLDFVTNARKF